MVTITEKLTVTGDGCELTIGGLTPQEKDLVEGSIRGGHRWMRVVDGNIQFVESHNPLPDPMEDDGMLPFWRTVRKEERSFTPMLLQGQDFIPNSSPSISIQHLCGHGYTPEGYRANAKKLESYGFQCMRSKRNTDGLYWEIWFLPALIFAEGPLKEAISVLKEKDRLSAALKFISHNVRFGTLDVSVQMLAMCHPD